MKNLGVVFSLALAGVLMSGCYITKQGDKFDARAYRQGKGATVASGTNGGKVTILTNLTSVATTNRIDAAWLAPSTNFFKLGPGDRLDIEILGDPASRSAVTIGPDGKIYYYILPGIDVWGLTLPEAQARLEEALKPYLNGPQVSIQLRGIDSTRVWVLGRVANPGIYPMTAPMTVLEAISLAGGTLTSSASGTTEDLADLSNSFIVRNGERLPIDFDRLLRGGDMSQNIYLEPDDFLYFPTSASRDIYVLGAVRTPKAVIHQHNTLVGAIADAGGPVKNAYLTHVAIVRGSLENPKIAIIDYAQVIRGKAPNVQLEPRDIVYVPYSPYRYLTKYLDLILRTFVRAVAINEGARAVNPGAAPAGVSIGVAGTGGTVLVPAGTVLTPGTKLVPVDSGTGGTVIR